ncbi:MULTISPECIES: hypothetical protein [Pseudomonas]|uniref:Secreted protein n=1 Tax=Pseudomonas kitaguniensis TaxID=2607908 RepID=A0A5N7KI96_9PSED|nr:MULTISPECIES: hypothetical protein [Pseudomonas]MPR01351.1 hypothetical protein [Pseudomonas kitaguniensis]
MKVKISLINTMLFAALQAGVSLTAAADPNVRVCDTTPTPMPILAIKHIDCSIPNSPSSVNRAYVDQNGNKTLQRVDGRRIVNCDSAGTCAHRGEFMGNAPEGIYGITTGWYLGTDTAGAVVAYKEGTGPGYGGNRYEPQATKKPSSSPVDVSKLDVVCMATAVFNCSINGQDIEDQDLPKYLPLVDKKDVKKQGGNCDSVPLCYDKNMMLLGLNKDLF